MRRIIGARIAAPLIAVVALALTSAAESEGAQPADSLAVAIGAAAQRHDVAELRLLESRVRGASSMDRNVYVAARGAIDLSYRRMFIQNFPTSVSAVSYDLAYVYPRVARVPRNSAFLQLLQFAQAGDESALRKAMQVLPHTDGAVAEVVSDGIAVAVNTRPKLALSVLSMLPTADQAAMIRRREVWCQTTRSISSVKLNTSESEMRYWKVNIQRMNCPSSYR